MIVARCLKYQAPWTDNWKADNKGVFCRKIPPLQTRSDSELDYFFYLKIKTIPPNMKCTDQRFGLEEVGFEW